MSTQPDPWRTSTWRRAFLLALIIPLWGCAGEERSPTNPGPVPGGGDGTAVLDSADTRILFIGNSLTYTNELPEVVGKLAHAAGRSVAYASMTRSGWSLQEHWEADAAERIRDLAPDYVVLQQGPSTLPESRDHLVYWTERFGPSIREGGGVPALLAVWPDRSRLQYLGAGTRAYAAAARAVDGTLIPAGETWIRAWEIDPALELYSPDNFHPSYLGTLAAAQTVVAVLLEVPPDSMPALDDGLSDAERTTLRRAVAATVDAEVDPD